MRWSQVRLRNKIQFSFPAIRRSPTSSSFLSLVLTCSGNSADVNICSFLRGNLPCQCHEVLAICRQVTLVSSSAEYSCSCLSCRMFDPVDHTYRTPYGHESRKCRQMGSAVEVGEIVIQYMMIILQPEQSWMEIESQRKLAWRVPIPKHYLTY